VISSDIIIELNLNIRGMNAKGF